MNKISSFDLDTTLIKFTDSDQWSHFTIRDAVEGVQIFGGIGSGKSSGSGNLIARKYLEHNFGGLVLTSKPDERQLWEEYCAKTGRLDDLIIIEPGGKQSFNFLDYESSAKNGSTTFTENIVQVLKTVIRSSEEKSGGKSDDPFWESSQDMLIYNVIDLCQLAYGTVSIQKLYNIVLTAPKKDEQRNDSTKGDTFAHAFERAQDNVAKQIEAFEQSLSKEERVKLNNKDAFENAILKAIPDAALLKSIDQFFVEHFRNLSEKTRSIIEFSFSGFLFRLLKEPVHSLFCNHESTFTPEQCLDGKIILLDLPVKIYHKVGRDSQVLFKYIWQRAMEKRKVSANGRPVFLWADESQHFLHEYDAEYQATARSSRIATVYISQNIPNYHANMGGIKSEYRVKSFLGTLGTKIFHANADIETNRHASDLIGEAYVEDESNTSTMAGKFSTSRTKSYKLERMVRPERFATLKTGGPKNNHQVEAYIHRQGNPFFDGLPFRKITFNQK